MLEACRWGYTAQVMTKLESTEGVKAFEGVFLSIRNMERLNRLGCAHNHHLEVGQIDCSPCSSCGSSPEKRDPNIDPKTLKSLL